MGKVEEMEKRLRVLLESSRPENRTKWAKKWKEQGKKVVGVFTPYIPEEVIFATGALPWGLSGTWQEATPLANAHRATMTCRYCTHVLESILSGEFDFLDAVVAHQNDDEIKRLYDVLHHVGKPPFAHLMYHPHDTRKIHTRMYVDSILGLRRFMKDLNGAEVTEDSLHRAIEVYNTTRNLLIRLYNLRKRESPPLTGAEFLGLTTAARVMPKDEFNRELKQLLPYLETRKASLKRYSPRIIVLGDYIDNPAYIKIVEDAEALVAMDDLDTGSRHIYGLVDASARNPWRALAKRYLNSPSGPSMINWNEQARRLISWIREFNIDGCVELRSLYMLPRDFMLTFTRRKLAEIDIPYISLAREYHLADTGMLTTRIAAFIEMIEAKGIKK